MPQISLFSMLGRDTGGTLPWPCSNPGAIQQHNSCNHQGSVLSGAKQKRGANLEPNAPTLTCLQLQDQAQAAALRGVEALEAATGVSLGSADQMEEDDEDEIDDEIDPDDEDEELAMQQPPVHDVHVSSEAAPAAGTSGRDRVPDPSRLVST